jgi:hypothetical protein
VDGVPYLIEKCLTFIEKHRASSPLHAAFIPPPCLLGKPLACPPQFVRIPPCGNKKLLTWNCHELPSPNQIWRQRECSDSAEPLRSSTL